MAVTLQQGHAWDAYQQVAHHLDDPTAPGVPWIAAIVEDATGRPIVTSDPAATEQAARADAEGKYEAWKQRNGAS
ncbi:hypothetical protein [Streptomyces cyanogenus]|uniref:Uncharacterized protein n=1 Tax=Streptomyces cyanogenus TaxID=80860 RepID=A0ABX7TQ68_STRCY|nr:hypothetical protein [Streptomyces cyanogenus]QTD96989.1 hypothetical protein S1361_06470 [Streptomyces cyanogenus]